YLLGEQAQTRIAIALLDVAEDLVVGAVLLDDVDAVLDRALLAELPRDGVARRPAARHRTAVALQRAARVRLLAVLRHLRRRRHRDDAHRPAHQPADV